MADILLIVGLSGAGRSQAADDLEDLGWFVVDNMPISLVDKVVELAENGADDLQLALVLGTPSNQTNAIDVVANQQDYDLDALWATPSASGAAIEIKRVFHEAPLKNLKRSFKSVI